METCVAGVFHRGADGRTRQVRRDGPGAGERGLKVTVIDVAGAQVRYAAGHQLQIVDVKVPCAIQINVESR